MTAPTVIAPPVTAPLATDPPATVPPATAPAVSPPTTLAAAAPTTTPPTSIAVTTTQAPSTTVPQQAAPPAAGPSVEIIGRVAPCRFGSECLVAGFAIHGFNVQPKEFVCEFASGSRYTFRFDSGGVEQACATSDTSSSITIEVAGVRSDIFRQP